MASGAGGFSINAWAACAPGLTRQAEWREWATSPSLPSGEPAPDLAGMAPMLRRRLSPTGRVALQAAYGCEPLAGDTPIVFASQYGDARRSLGLLAELVLGQPVSPTAFGLSVHNAIGAMFSIARSDRTNYTAVSAGESSPAAGVLEALGLLADGHAEVLLVCYDTTLPQDYAGFQRQPAAAYAWAWRIGRAAPSCPGFELDLDGDQGAEEVAEPALPLGLDLLRFALSKGSVFRRRADNRLWSLRRHA